MKKNKKDEIIIINPIKTLKRFLKENNMYTAYMKYTRGNKSITEKLKNINPKDYFNTSLINENVKLGYMSKWIIQQYFQTLSKKWETYLDYEVNKEEYINKFILFLKKRGILNLYESCFAPYYANKLKSTIIGKEISLENEIIIWQDLSPKHFIKSAFDHTDTIKTETFWKELDEKWQKEIKTNKSNVKYIYDL